MPKSFIPLSHKVFIVLIIILSISCLLVRPTRFVTHLSNEKVRLTPKRASTKKLNFPCPKSLFEAWNTTYSSLNESALSSSLPDETPQVVLMRLEKEKGSFYLNRTIKSLVEHSHSFCEADAVYGPELLGKNFNQSQVKDLFGVNFSSKLRAGEIGIWMSHLSAWYHGLKYSTPVISLESDTRAVRNWDIDPALYEEFDILYLHLYQKIRNKCYSNDKDDSDHHHVRETIDTWYGAGAMLFTNNDPVKVWRIFQEELFEKTVVKPIDHWMNEMWETKKLRIGSLCPYNFELVQDHDSTIQTT